MPVAALLMRTSIRPKHSAVFSQPPQSVRGSKVSFKARTSVRIPRVGWRRDATRPSLSRMARDVTSFSKRGSGGGSDATGSSSDEGDFHTISVSRITARLSPSFTAGQFLSTIMRPLLSAVTAMPGVFSGSTTFPRIWPCSTVCPRATADSK